MSATLMCRFVLGIDADSGVKWHCVWSSVSKQPVIAMAHLVEKQTLLRANSAMMLTLVGGGLIVCALGAVVFDIGRAVGVW